MPSSLVKEKQPPNAVALPSPSPSLSPPPSITRARTPNRNYNRLTFASPSLDLAIASPSPVRYVSGLRLRLNSAQRRDPFPLLCFPLGRFESLCVCPLEFLAGRREGLGHWSRVLWLGLLCGWWQGADARGGSGGAEISALWWIRHRSHLLLFVFHGCYAQGEDNIRMAKRCFWFIQDNLNLHFAVYAFCSDTFFSFKYKHDIYVRRRRVAVKVG